MADTTPPVVTKVLNFGDLVIQVLGKEYKKPEVVYEFSKDRDFTSTDATTSGIYK